MRLSFGPGVRLMQRPATAMLSCTQARMFCWSEAIMFSRATARRSLRYWAADRGLGLYVNTVAEVNLTSLNLHRRQKRGCLNIIPLSFA